MHECLCVLCILNTCVGVCVCVCGANVGVCVCEANVGLPTWCVFSVLRAFAGPLQRFGHCSILKLRQSEGVDSHWLKLSRALTSLSSRPVRH